MKNKTPLALMEQTIMVLVFSLAAALCLWVFVWSDQASNTVVAKDQAAVAAQQAAEAIKHAGASGADAPSVLEAVAHTLDGAYEPAEGVLVLHYDEGWQKTQDSTSAAFALYARPVPSDVKGLGEATVEVVAPESQEPLFTIPVAWQTGVRS